MIRASPSAGSIKNFWNGRESGYARARRIKPRWRMPKDWGSCPRHSKNRWAP